MVDITEKMTWEGGMFTTAYTCASLYQLPPLTYHDSEKMGRGSCAMGYNSGTLFQSRINYFTI